MKKYVICAIFIGIAALLSGCGSKIPSTKDIMSDISENIRILTVENPFTGSIDYQDLEITNFEIDKSQTTDSRYRAYCIIDMENDFYQYTKFIVCEYVRYDGNKWELDDYKEYKDTEFAVIGNPFTEEDIYASSYIIKSAVKEVNWELNDNEICCQYTYDMDHKYKTSSTRNTEWYTFNGTDWKQLNTNRTTTNNWNIIGSWKLVNGPDGAEFELVIDSFDSKNKTGSGYCKFSYIGGPAYPIKGSNTYRIEEAEIVETDTGNLIIMFDGDVDSIILGWGSDVFISISSNEAKAYYGSYWREEIELCSTETASIDTIEYMLMPDVVGMTVEEAEQTLKKLGFTVIQIEGYFDVVAEGIVASQVPAASEKAPSGASITLTVSLGPQRNTVKVPYLIGMSEAEGRITLAERGLTAGGIHYEYNSEYAADIIFNQSYTWDVDVEPGTAIDFWVSKGPSTTAESETYK